MHNSNIHESVDRTELYEFSLIVKKSQYEKCKQCQEKNFKI